MCARRAPLAVFTQVRLYSRVFESRRRERAIRFMESRAASHIKLSSIPIPVLVALAAVGFLAVGAVLLYIMPKWQHGQILRKNLAPGLALFAVSSFFSRIVLWYGAVIFLPMALAVLVIGKLPEDLPESTDPAIRDHPQYPAIRRRGIAASIAVMAVILGGAVVTAVVVR